MGHDRAALSFVSLQQPAVASRSAGARTAHSVGDRGVVICFRPAALRAQHPAHEPAKAAARAQGSRGGRRRGALGRSSAHPGGVERQLVVTGDHCRTGEAQE